MTSANASAGGRDARIGFLDGMRGLAIFAVILFHAYVRWPDVVPFGDRYSGVPWVAYGWLGVQLFFMISGFVILMTLEKCASWSEFIRRRWLRLFPAMLCCSALIFVTAPLFPERPAGPATLRDLLPGLTFIDPPWWSLVLASPQGVIESAFWSIFVEVKFYLIAGLVYFLAGGSAMIATLVGLFLAAAAVTGIGKGAFAIDLYGLPMVLELVSAKYFGWFAAGALYYKYFAERSREVLGLAILVASTAALMQDGYQYRPEVFALAVVIGFSAAIVSAPVQRLLSNPVLLFMGFISYPLYLIHENMMIAAIVKIGEALPWLPAAAVPVIPIAAVCMFAWLVAAHAEPWLSARLRPILFSRVPRMEGASRS